MHGRLLLVGLEDGLVLVSQDVLHSSTRPPNERNVNLLCLTHAVVDTVVCENNDMSMCKDCCHILCVLNGRGGSNNVEKVLVRNAGKSLCLHLSEKLLFNGMVVGVIAGMTSGTLIGLRRGVASPHSSILFLGKCKSEVDEQMLSY